MTATPLGDVMDALGTALADVDGVTVYDFPPLSAVPPFAFVGMPEQTVYDDTMGRGFDRHTIPVYVGVHAATAVDSRDKVVAFVDGDVVKAALEGITDFAVRVTQATFGTVELANASYAGVTFTVDVSA